MEKKDNIYKKIARILLIGFVLFSLYSVCFMDDIDNPWMSVPYVIGAFAFIGCGVVLGLFIVGVGIFLITRFLNWAFNTDYFD